MKKIAKLSLVAAVAVAGFSTANAQPLEEAIKNVEVSGSVVYRYNDYNNNSKDEIAKDNSSTTNNYKVALGLASKVNEDVKFNSRFLVADDNGNFGSLDTQAPAGGDGNIDVELSNAYFGYTGLANTTVNVGKQGLTTPWTVAIDSDGNEQTGTGILALSTVGPVTLAAAYFNQTNLNSSTDARISGLNLSASGISATRNQIDVDRDLAASGTSLTGNYGVSGNSDVMTVGAIANLKPVTLDAWYLDLADTFDSYTVGAKADFDLSGVKLGVDARYASLKFDSEFADDLGNQLTRDIRRLVNPLAPAETFDRSNAMAKIALTAKAGIVNGKLAYANTSKKGGLTALDNDANTTLLGWNLNANGKADADYWQAVVGVDILSNLNLSANYGNLQYEDKFFEEEEIYAQLTYKMSKNLSTYVRYGTYTKEIESEIGTGTTGKEINDDVRGRLQVEYTF